MPTNFISYARDDDEMFVEKLQIDLRQAGLDVWWDREAMASRGRTFLQEIRDAIASSSRVILVLGPRAVESPYVQAEWQLAVELCTPVANRLQKISRKKSLLRPLDRRELVFRLQPFGLVSGQ